MTQEMIKDLYLKSVKKTDEMEASEDYDGRDYDYEQGYQDALETLFHNLYGIFLWDFVEQN